MPAPIHTPFSDVVRQADRTPGKLAVVSDAGDALTYGELVDRVSSVARALACRSVTRADRVCVESGRAVDNLVGMIAAMAAGGIAVSLPNDIGTYQEVLSDTQPSVVLATAAGLPEDARKGAQIVNRISVREIWGDADPAHGDRVWHEPDPEDTAHIYYTSGTTSGIRKGAMQSYRALHATADYITSAMQMTEDVCEYVASPVDNAFWFGRCRCVLRSGGTLLLSSGVLNPLEILSSLSRNSGNALSGDSSIFMLFLQQMERQFLRVASGLRWVKVASQPMPIEARRRLMELLPQARIVMSYGLTEAMRAALLPFGDFPDKLASVGRPSPGVTIRISDESGRELPAGETGEVWIAGDNVATGYWRNPDLWSERFDGGWYRSRDLGYLDTDGFLFLKGRIDQAINVGGKTIALNEVEERLRPVLPRSTFAVCGVRDPNGILGDLLVLCVEGEWTEPELWPDLRIHLFERMEPSFVPKEAFLVARLPRTANGKIQTALLKQEIEAGRYLRRLPSQPRRLQSKLQ
jgi:long-chain acyl-CoA synthetase